MLKLSDFDFVIVYRRIEQWQCRWPSRQAWEAEQSSDNEQLKESAVVRRVEPDFRQLSKHLRPDDQEPVPGRAAEVGSCVLFGRPK